MSILAYVASAILYVTIGWMAARDDMALPLVVALAACAAALGALIVCGGAR